MNFGVGSCAVFRDVSLGYAVNVIAGNLLKTSSFSNASGRYKTKQKLEEGKHPRRGVLSANYWNSPSNLNQRLYWFLSYSTFLVFLVHCCRLWRTNTTAHLNAECFVASPATKIVFSLFSAEKFLHLNGSAFIRKYFLSRSVCSSFFNKKSEFRRFSNGHHDDSPLHSHRVCPLLLVHFLVHRHV